MQKMQEIYWKTIAEWSVDVAKRSCLKVKLWRFCCIFISVHSAISSTSCSLLRVRWSLIFRKPCRTTALWSWKAACSSSSCSSLIWELVVSLTTSQRQCRDTASKTQSSSRCSKDRIISFDSLYTAHVWWHGKRIHVSVFTWNYIPNWGIYM